MRLRLERTTHSDESTIGELSINDSFSCFTLEDAKRDHKVWGVTCIPAGTYKLELRNEGGMTQRYAKRYPNHRGMIWLRHVPMFEWIYIHVGNKPADTNGCILVGETTDDNFIGSSRAAYESIYDSIADAIESPEGCTITIID
jgi:hypothetical protein